MRKWLIEGAKWNGEPCEAYRVVVVVGRSERPTWWCADLEGTQRKAVEIVAAQGAPCEPFYLDDEDGSGTNKVLCCGMWNHGHKSLPVFGVVS
jgi:hypothetical protein